MEKSKNGWTSPTFWTSVYYTYFIPVLQTVLTPLSYVRWVPNLPRTGYIDFNNPPEKAFMTPKMNASSGILSASDIGQNRSSESEQPLVRIMVVGPVGSGKSSFCKRLSTGKFEDNSLSPTIGYDSVRVSIDTPKVLATLDEKCLNLSSDVILRYAKIMPSQSTSTHEDIEGAGVFPSPGLSYTKDILGFSVDNSVSCLFYDFSGNLRFHGLQRSVQRNASAIILTFPITEAIKLKHFCQVVSNKVSDLSLNAKLPVVLCLTMADLVLTQDQNYCNSQELPKDLLAEVDDLVGQGIVAAVTITSAALDIGVEETFALSLALAICSRVKNQ